MDNPAANALLILRSLLRDEKLDDLRFSQGQLLEILSLVRNKLISEFSQNVHALQKEVCDEPFVLPLQIAVIYECKLNGAPLGYKSLKMALRHTEPCLYHLRKNIYNIAKNPHKRAEFKLIASFFMPLLQSGDDELGLDFMFNKALALGSLCDVLLIETHTQNIAKLQAFRAEFELEKNNLRALINKSQAPTNLYTKAEF